VKEIRDGERKKRNSGRGKAEGFGAEPARERGARGCAENRFRMWAIMHLSGAGFPGKGGAPRGEVKCDVQHQMNSFFPPRMPGTATAIKVWPAECLQL
jgi:hypothetical protein